MIQSEQSAIRNFLNKGNEYFDNGNYLQAISEYIRVIQADKERYQDFCQRGIYFAGLGKEQSAIYNFISQYNMITISDLAQYLRGMAYKQINKTQDAISDLTQIIQSCPQFKFCFDDRGNAHRSLQQLELAILDYSEAIKLDSQYVIAYINRGIFLYYALLLSLTLEDQGRKQEALIDYNSAIEINPINDANAYFNRGNLLNDLGRKEEALIDYNKTIEINPKYVNAYNNRGNLLSDLGRKEEAQIDFNKIIEINQINVGDFNTKGHLDRKQDALIDQNKINPKYVNAFNHRGFFSNQQFSQVSNNKGVCLQGLPRYEIYNQKGLFLHSLKRYDQAIQMYDHAIKKNPKYCESYINKGYSLMNQQRYEEADRQFTKSIEIKNFK